MKRKIKKGVSNRRDAGGRDPSHGFQNLDKPQPTYVTDYHSIPFAVKRLTGRKNTALAETIQKVVEWAWDAESIRFALKGKTLVVSFSPPTNRDAVVAKMLPVIVDNIGEDHAWMLEYRSNCEES